MSNYILDEDGNVFYFSSVIKNFNSLLPQDVFSYNKYNKDISDDLFNWVFHRNKVFEYQNVFLTNGAKEGLVSSLYFLTDKDDFIIAGVPMWSGYPRAVRGLERRLCSYSFFDKYGKFNLYDFLEKCKLIIQKQEFLFIILNLPCHNPSGYSISGEEFKNIISGINEIVKNMNKMVYLYLDMVYLDFETNGYMQNIIDEFQNFSENILVLIQFSFSKSMTLYGFSDGVLIAGSKSGSLMNDFSLKMDNFYKNISSNRSGYFSVFFQKIMKDKIYAFELDNVKKMFRIRAEKILECCSKYDLKVLPYSAGFTMFLFCDNSRDVCENLKLKGIFLKSLKSGIVIPLFAMPCFCIDDGMKMISESVKG